MNHLKNQTSPYLLQHAENPVEWYPWCEEAFERAKKEDKPIFLSIGYSTCHWCHVMAEECFEDQDVADLLNHGFISIKVDREERPDLDAVYMAACQAMTGNGGWPMSIFMTADQKPFFTGTYFPKHSRSGMTGFKDILTYIADVWKSNRSRLLNAAETLHLHLKNMEKCRDCDTLDYETGRKLLNQGILQLKKQFDREYGGFGAAPKFPMPHNLMFLMQQYEERGDKELLQIAEKTLMQMYKGGIFDHLGGGFSRYSTDRYFLIPHFEKMLYDNSLLIAAYCRGYDLTRKQIYLDAAEHTAQWILREMQGGHGGFYSAQDADSQGEEGLFYVFSYDEIIQLLGPIEGRNFASHYGMTEDGYFEGKNVLNLLAHEHPKEADESLREKVFQYRKKRYPLHTDDKILTAWNGMTAWALSLLYRITGKRNYLDGAEGCIRFVTEKMTEADGKFRLSVSWRNGAASGNGFLDDYAWVICGILGLYEVTGKDDYLKKAQMLTEHVLQHFSDDKGSGGFTIAGTENERLLLNLKETYDGALPSGNGVMAYNLVKLMHYSTGSRYADTFEEVAEKQMTFLADDAAKYPAGHCFFLMALSLWLDSSSLYVCRDGACAVPRAGRKNRAEDYHEAD